MKTLKLTTLLLAVALVFGSTSCKYEDGPGLSLRTKKARVAGEWTIEKIIESDGTEITPSDIGFGNYTAVFDKDGTGSTSFTFTFLGTTTTDKSTFKWEFSDSKKKLKVTDEVGEVDESTILRLTNDEMWVKNSAGDQTNFKAK